MTPLQPSADNLVAWAFEQEEYGEWVTRLSLSREAGEGDGKRNLRPLYAHPSRGVVDEAMVERIEAVRQGAIRAWEKEVGVLVSMNRQEACRVGMRAALQAAALPAVPKADEVDVDAVMAIIDKWMISYDHIGTGSARSGQISEREWEEDRAKLLELLAATPAHDQPEGSDND